jgi:hypothetical protein
MMSSWSGDDFKIAINMAGQYPPAPIPPAFSIS